MATASICKRSLYTYSWAPLTLTAPSQLHCYRSDQELHCLLKTLPRHVFDTYSCAPRQSLLLQNPVSSRVWQVFLCPLVLTATTKPHGVTILKYISVSLKLISASKLCRVAGLVCLKASPFSSSLIRNRRHRHNVSFASTPTVWKSWCVWEIAIIAVCEWSR
jgi:hypothetical protein